MTEAQKDDFGSEEDQEINSKSRKKMKISKTISKTHAFDGRRRVDVSDKDTLNHRRFLAEKNEIKLVYNLPKKSQYNQHSPGHMETEVLSSRQSSRI